MEKTGMAAFRPQIEKADGWSNANGGTVDLFIRSDHACADGIPENYMGSQDGADGNYAGIIAYYGDERISIPKSFEKGEVSEANGYGRYTEYLQGELSEPLKAGGIYTFSFQVSLAEASDRAIRGLGAYFTAEKQHMKGNSFMNVDPQIVSRELVADMDGWTEIKGSFIAHGGERYVTIGAFPQYLTVTNIANVNENDSRKAYYYIARPKLTAGPQAKPPVVRTISSAVEEVDRAGTVFLGIHFATGSAEFRPGDIEKLEAVARVLRENPDLKIRVDGHTDAIGSEEYNLALSERRAFAVRSYLVEHGVAASRIKTSGYGEQFPVEHTAYESVKNRRIELYRLE
jgi:outer membrane protein OmpA-like peptidoglycan-associated protein